MPTDFEQEIGQPNPTPNTNESHDPREAEVINILAKHKVFYHGASISDAEEIRKKGLMPNIRGELFLTPFPQEARYWAKLMLPTRPGSPFDTSEDVPDDAIVIFEVPSAAINPRLAGVDYNSNPQVNLVVYTSIPADKLREYA